MSRDRHIVHLVDDLAMGGVKRALKNFEHPSLSLCGKHVVVDIRVERPEIKSDADIVIIHFTANWRKLLRFMDLRWLRGFSEVILVEHTYTAGFEKACVPKSERFRRMLRLAYGFVDRVVAVSTSQMDWILECGLAEADKVSVIPQSRDCSTLLGLALPCKNKRPLQIGAFGRFTYQKGFDLLLEAMTHIPPSVAELTLAGSGEDEAYLLRVAEALPNVCISPAFEDPKIFLSAVDVVAIPSRWEAFGLVGTEARAAGRPLIAARVDGLNDQIGEHSFTFDVGNVEQLVCAIYEAAEAVDFNERCARARADVTSEFETMIKGWQNLLKAA